MSSNVSAARAAVRIVTPASGSESDFTPASGSEEREWFHDAVLQICGRKDPGYQLHLFTGWPVSSCRSFVARDPDQRRKPPVEFLRILFRSNQGEPFFRAFMHGSASHWYADLMRAEQRALAAEATLRAVGDLIVPKR